jgi:ferredoxin
MRTAERPKAGGLLNLSELIVEEELCVNLRGRVAHCAACRESCPAGALNPTPDGVDLDETLCTGCNRCLPGCPAGALRSTGFVPSRFLRALIESQQRDLHCRVSSDGGGGIVIPCHGVLDVRLLAAARAEGITELHLHGLNRCENCRFGDARPHITSLVSQLNEWLEEGSLLLDLSPEVERARRDTHRHYQDQPHVSRRTFLRFGGAKTVTQAVDWMVPGLAQGEEDEEALPFYQADDYPQRAAAYQQEAALRVGSIPWHTGQALPLKMRRVAGHCSACLSCGERCPTGALHATETAQVRELSFDPLACTDCGLCEAICPQDALITEPVYDPAALKGRTTLLLRRQRLCLQCRSPFLPAGPEIEICPLCSNEQELDEAWLDMLSG